MKTLFIPWIFKNHPSDALNSQIYLCYIPRAMSLTVCLVARSFASYKHNIASIILSSHSRKTLVFHWHDKSETSLLIIPSLKFHQHWTVPGGSLKFGAAQVGMPSPSEINHSIIFYLQENRNYSYWHREK